MNCMDWEERIALYAGGDLAEAQRLDVERHLGECAGCQVFASGLTESLEWVRQAHAEEVAPVHFAAVRARVMSKLEGRRRRFFVWGLAAVSAAAMLVAVAPTLWETAGIRPPEVAMAHPAVPAQALVIPKPLGRDSRIGEPERPRPNRTPVTRAVTAKARPTEPLVIKLVTDNPDVVIYWIVDRKGE